MRALFSKKVAAGKAEKGKILTSIVAPASVSTSVEETTQKGNSTWKFEGDSAFHALGVHGIIDGEIPSVDEVADNRYQRMKYISSLLDLCPTDVTLDLGSGMGFMAEVVAPKVKHVVCADISDSFLKTCAERTARFNNVSTKLIKYADLTALQGLKINKAYSTLLFIHFNFYDFTYYLQQMHAILEPGALFFFDYNDGDRYIYGNKDDSFIEHLKIYKDVREQWVFNCMHMSSTATLHNILPQLGFEIVKILPMAGASFTEIIIRKKA